MAKALTPFIASLFDEFEDNPPFRKTRICEALLLSSVTDGVAAQAMMDLVDGLFATGQGHRVVRYQNGELIDWPEMARLVNQVNRGIASDRPLPSAEAIRAAATTLKAGVA